jgi:hypothetical protein
MKATLIRGLAAATAGGALLAAVVLTGGPEGYAQEAKAEAKGGGGVHAGVESIHCIQCHGDGTGSGYKAYEARGITNFVSLKERVTWQTQDLHSMALANITPDRKGGLADRMQKVLENSPSRKGKDYHIERADECLACHAVDREEKAVTAGAMTAGRFHADKDIGVGCEACHGLVSADWVGAHFDKSWRAKTAAEKADPKYNQTDLRDTSVRAAKCASCHIGDREHGKFVTHEMFAAGHPPLPPFELATYAHDAPRHYFTHREIEKNYLATLDKAEAETTRKNLHIHPGECDDARSFAVGALATFEANMKLVADAASETKDGELMDFAVFDCWACHHDLKDPSWRQKRGYKGVPGRPVLRTSVALDAVLDFAGGAAGVDTGKLTAAGKQLTETLDATPFGEPKNVRPKALALAEQCAAIRKDMAPIVYDPAQAEVLYRKLADKLAKSTAIDPDAAQQAVWGLWAIRQDLKAAGKPGFDTPAPKALEVMTPLRVRPEQREPVAGPRMRARMEEIGKFDPEQFHKAVEGWLKESGGK